jgi:preprotein translocase subunit YajC
MTGLPTLINLIAQAAPQPQQQGSPLAGLISFAPMILIIVAMWFLIIAPQRKKMKEHQKMVEALSTGDEVVTSGGIFGTIAQRKEDRFVVRIADNCKIEVERNSITSVVKKS